MERVPTAKADAIVTQTEMRPCPYCSKLFTPVRLRQAFCSNQCRMHYHKDVGTEGEVASVTRLMRGRVSVVLHFDSGPAAERAVLLLKGERKRIV